MIQTLKISLLLVLSLGLISCFGGSADTERGLVIQETEAFQIKVPSTWSQISAADLPLPKSWEIEFAYASPTQRQGYMNNIIVLSSENKQKESSQGLMKSNAHFLNQNLESFTLAEEKAITYTDGDAGLLVRFTGKYNTSTPEVVYLQTAKSCGDNSYYITLSLAEKLDSYERYEYLLKAFECK